MNMRRLYFRAFNVGKKPPGSGSRPVRALVGCKSGAGSLRVSHVGWKGRRAMSVAESGGAQVKSAVRTVELLEYFAGRPGMHSLAAVQEAVGYPKSSLYMLLRTLVELGWVETDATGT
ncbi:helix-turn-helix domain-containing protein, partial [Streptomyces mirabilis]